MVATLTGNPAGPYALYEPLGQRTGLGLTRRPIGDFDYVMDPPNIAVDYPGLATLAPKGIAHGE
jgi:hypothetical protein